MVARSPFGPGAATWPVVETVQRNGQCAVVIAPAPALSSAVAEEAEQLALAHRVRARCCRPRWPSNSSRRLTALSWSTSWPCARTTPVTGRWTAPRTSQFEQHLRAVLDYPARRHLADREPVTVMANVLGAPEAPEMDDGRACPSPVRSGCPTRRSTCTARVSARIARSGHVNIVGGAGSIDDPNYVAAVRERAERAAHWLSYAVWTDGWDVHGE